MTSITTDLRSSTPGAINSTLHKASPPADLPSPPLSQSSSPPSPPSHDDAQLYPVPLKPTGALHRSKYPRTSLTTALGEQFDESVRLREILDLPKEQGDDILRDLAILVSWRGVVFFKDQHDLVPEDLGRLALRLGELAGKPDEASLHIHPTQELSETGLPLGKISSKPDASGRQ
ncbi:hypothetical protein JCM10212_005322, partial [Sporobolomyces blumeae]